MNRWKEGLRERKEEGAALVIAIILLSAVEILGFALITMSQIDYSVASNIARSEETYYYAEQGVMIGIDWVSDPINAALVPVGSTQQIYSAEHRGKAVYAVNADPWPRWQTTLTNLGVAPPRPGQPTSLKSFRYLIESNAIYSARGIARMIMAEVGIVQRGCFGGLCDVSGGSDTEVSRKLAATTHP